MCFEVNLLALFSAQLDVDQLELVDMDYGKSDRIVFLARDNSKHQYFFIVCVESQNDRDLVSVVGVKPLSESVKSSSHGENPSLSLSNGGPIALVQFSDKIVISYVFDDIQFEEIIPFKKNDLIGCGVDRSKVDMESIDSISTSALFSFSSGVLEVEVLLSSLIRASRRKELPKDNEKSNEFYTMLEQSVFFGGLGNNDNPIQFDLGSLAGDLSIPCLKLSESILKSSNILLPSTLDETEYLKEATVRMEQLLRTILNYGLINHVNMF
jgi:hypothetical protein